VGCYQRGQAPCRSDAAQWKDAVTEAALAFQMLCMFGQLSPLLGDLKISLLRTGIACSFRPSFGFFGSLPVFFRSFHADALRSLNEFRTPGCFIIEPDHGAPIWPSDKRGMPNRLLFTCPITRMKVQHWLDSDENTSVNEYEAITCQACARIHLINRKTGKLLGQEDQ
jgi:hypothetical protein